MALVHSQNEKRKVTIESEHIIEISKKKINWKIRKKAFRSRMG